MRYDMKIPRPKKDGGTYWHKIGAVFTDDDGSLTRLFDSLPIPNEKGVTMAKGYKPTPRDDGQDVRRVEESDTHGQDSIPF